MKPRPLSLLAIPSRQPRSALNVQCHRQFHLHRLAVLPSLTQPQWHDRSVTTSIHPYLPRSQFLRHASSSNAAAVKPSPSSAVHTNPSKPKSQIAASTRLTTSHAPLRTAEASEKLNPPQETYAPELNLPEQKPGQGKLKWLFHAGRAYIAFYKGGIKNVRSTASLAKSIRAKAQGRKEEDVFTRAEWQIVRRSKRDMLRLPAFGILVLLLGEWLPLIALYITPVIPEPCRIPGQTKRSLEKQEKRRRERQRRLGLDAARLVGTDRKPGIPRSMNAVPAVNSVGPEDVDRLDLFSLLALSTKLDAHSKFWDFVFLTPPKSILRWDVGRKLAYLRKDDGLIQRDGGWQGLGKEEGKRACIERGINVLGRSDQNMRNDLAAWFAKR
ncbi:hypothetical protein K505DRAFT_324388 [Melanomma pulvis-pyrius CBS 109.77]|uniref:Letm1 RBD domain-containing protein n=1 Tax=Melanomma pulvis-pyrius CBS 109.77 TaxID=1314802 RepID=A0A6A6XH47_9PLEO|nr:hypothetical protein K505DRAFT_324388 [Melanomma pulvis-pyrius CBS 109.77]